MERQEPQTLNLSDSGDFGAPRRTANQFVRDSLRRAILNKQIPPGSRLVQAEIARQLNVSSTPVREALRELAAEGLVRLDAHHTATVNTGDLDDLEEIYALRRMLEPYCTRLAVERISEEELSRAQDLNSRMREVANPAEWVRLNSEFHGILSDAAGSPRLSAILKGLRDSASVYVSVRIQTEEELQASNLDHRRIVDAFVARDAETAAATVLAHITGTKAVVSKELA